MNNFMNFMAKEMLEAWRRKRFLVLSIVFLFVALISPTMTRYINEFLELLIPAEDLNAMGVMLLTPHWSTSYQSFYMNLNQIGMIALILLGMGIVVSEVRRGTAALMMVKGLTHTTFMLVKFAAFSLMVFVVLLISLLLQHFLTLAFFGAGAAVGNLILGFALYWLFSMMIISLIIFTSTIAQSVGMAAVFGILGFMAFSIPAGLPRLREPFPYTLSARAHEITTAGYVSEFLWLNILTAILTTALFLAASILILRKKEL